MSDTSYQPDQQRGWPVATRELAQGASRGGAGSPLICRWPMSAAPEGIIVFCHGLGASGRDYAALSQHWATHGYLVVHPTFDDSFEVVTAAEPELLQGAASDPSHWMSDPNLRIRMHEILHTPAYWLRRVERVRALLDDLNAVIAATCGLPGKPARVAIAGHSFGAYTAQLFAGARIDLPGRGWTGFRDDRFAAALLLSAQGRDQQGLREGSWDEIIGPMMNVTGTLDGGAKGQDWHWKIEPYEFAPPGHKYLALLQGADHYLGGIARPDQSPVPAQREAVEMLSLAFFDAHLRNDPRAHVWLAGVSKRIGACELAFSRK